MIDSTFGPSFERVFVAPVARVFSKIPKCHPIHITLFGGAVGIAGAVMVGLGYPLLAIGLLMLSGYLDALDGGLARLSGQMSDFGAALDIVMDRCVEVAVVFGLYFVDPATRGFYALLVLSAIMVCVTTFLVVGVFEQRQSHKSFHYSSGLMERSEAGIFVILAVLLPTHFAIIACVFAALTIFTAVRRMVQFGLFHIRP